MIKIISSFKPSLSYRQLNNVLASLLKGCPHEEPRKEFERKFAQYIGVKHAIYAPSGRWALYYILKCLALNDGDEVILPAFTYFAVPAAIVKSGLRPVFTDVKRDSLSVDIDKIKENISEKTKVIIPTHLCGFVYDLDRIIDIARENNIFVVEDCAQSLGAEYMGRKAGSLGGASYYTFGLTKNFTTLGGAMITTDSDELAGKIRACTGHIGRTGRGALFFKLIDAYKMKLATSRQLFPLLYLVINILSFFGLDIIDALFREKAAFLGDLPKSGQLNKIQAKLGLDQLANLVFKTDIKVKKGLFLYSRLKDNANIRVPTLDEKAKNIFSGCPVMVERKKNMREMLLKRGIDTSSGYMQDCSNMDVFREFRRDCPNSRSLEDSVVYLPLYEELSYSELDYISDIVIKTVSLL
ncbi:MAG: aminotransferase class I/II-fold pyridoxal phosphate-dependent enzyme [Candidatus Omnitrophica bacterium]|nr:aminotransferase class I/II-fold pyridoxal phosphate-dependent enzyme [Candidatus Omnitrophota bacterium]